MSPAERTIQLQQIGRTVADPKTPSEVRKRMLRHARLIRAAGHGPSTSTRAAEVNWPHLPLQGTIERGERTLHLWQLRRRARAVSAESLGERISRATAGRSLRFVAEGALLAGSGLASGGRESGGG
jgi:hypothetical protein